MTPEVVTLMLEGLREVLGFARWAAEGAGTTFVCLVVGAAFGWLMRDR